MKKFVKIVMPLIFLGGAGVLQAQVPMNSDSHSSAGLKKPGTGPFGGSDKNPFHKPKDTGSAGDRWNGKGSPNGKDTGSALDARKGKGSKGNGKYNKALGTHSKITKVGTKSGGSNPAGGPTTTGGNPMGGNPNNPNNPTNPAGGPTTGGGNPLTGNPNNPNNPTGGSNPPGTGNNPAGGPATGNSPAGSGLGESSSN